MKRIRIRIPFHKCPFGVVLICFAVKSLNPLYTHVRVVISTGSLGFELELTTVVKLLSLYFENAPKQKAAHTQDT